MNREILITFILIIHLSTFLNGQNMDSIGIDNNPYLNIQESDFLNSQLINVKDTFDFKNKKVAYYLSLVGYIQKQEFFKEAKPYSEKGHDMAAQIIILDEREKEATKGFDAIVVIWHKILITKNSRQFFIDKLIKAST